jgi:hypothetical protein
VHLAHPIEVTEDLAIVLVSHEPCEVAAEDHLAELDLLVIESKLFNALRHLSGEAFVARDKMALNQ